MLEKLFSQFAAVNALTFQSRSQTGSQMNWNMNGTGTVSVRVHNDYIDFDEEIVLENGRVCYDKKRWRFSGCGVYFERFRNDVYEQIFEFEYQNGEFVPQQPYWCDPDNYQAELSVNSQVIVLTIYIHSSRKNECLRYEYVAQ